MGMFKNRKSDLGLVTRNIHWLLLMGVSYYRGDGRRAGLVAGRGAAGQAS